MQKHIAIQIQQFDDRIDSIEVLDFSWAIWGLLNLFRGHGAQLRNLTG